MKTSRPRVKGVLAMLAYAAIVATGTCRGCDHAPLAGLSDALAQWSNLVAGGLLTEP